MVNPGAVDFIVYVNGRHVTEISIDENKVPVSVISTLERGIEEGQENRIPIEKIFPFVESNNMEFGPFNW